MIAYGEHEFALDRKLDDGATERAHLESVERQIKNLPGWKGKAKVVPEAPDFPVLIDWVWDWFQQYSFGIAQNGMGPATGTWEGLQAWAMTMRITLEPWEAMTILRLCHTRAQILGGRAAREERRVPPSAGRSP